MTAPIMKNAMETPKNITAGMWLALKDFFCNFEVLSIKNKPKTITKIFCILIQLSAATDTTSIF